MLAHHPTLPLVRPELLAIYPGLFSPTDTQMSVETKDNPLRMPVRPIPVSGLLQAPQYPVHSSDEDSDADINVTGKYNC